MSNMDTTMMLIASSCDGGGSQPETDLADDVFKVDVPRLGLADRGSDPGSGSEGGSGEERHDDEKRDELYEETAPGAMI